MVIELQRDQGHYSVQDNKIRSSAILLYRDLLTAVSNSSFHAPPDKKSRNSPTKTKTGSSACEYSMMQCCM